MARPIEEPRILNPNPKEQDEYHYRLALVIYYWMQMHDNGYSSLSEYLLDISKGKKMILSDNSTRIALAEKIGSVDIDALNIATYHRNHKETGGLTWPSAFKMMKICEGLGEELTLYLFFGIFRTQKETEQSKVIENLKNQLSKLMTENEQLNREKDALMTQLLKS